jgi:hypothetical protein
MPADTEDALNATYARAFVIGGDDYVPAISCSFFAQWLLLSLNVHQRRLSYLAPAR